MAVSSTMLPLGTPAPDFALPEVTDDATVSLDGLSDAPVLVVVFLSRHCPYVKHLEARLATVATDLQQQGAAFVGICANDAEAYPDDAPAMLAEQKRTVGLPFPYLHDASQAVARAYGAACTPDFFVFDRDRRLAYRGQFDASRPGQGEPSGQDLVAAVQAVLAGEQPPADQRPSIGCSIKWRHDTPA